MQRGGGRAGHAIKPRGLRRLGRRSRCGELQGDGQTPVEPLRPRAHRHAPCEDAAAATGPQRGHEPPDREGTSN